MSEENPYTTAVSVTNPTKTRVKDPRKVESGRRLAKISKEAKARKKAQLEAIKEEEQSITDTEDKAAGAALVYIHTVGAVEARHKATETERKESEDRMLNTLERRFSLILEEKQMEK
ncbi:Hypothetical predicted protein [Paramuricea clavata]|uniref:Uncharacterized protein n=1 Tax=Paramuricea clavata TaxID=317549 RepID=A0A7D9DFQ4_PARCT|nr:Hypothetical predicted protein [Paramuricea clavata]